MEKVLRSRRLIIEAVLSETPKSSQILMALSEVTEDMETEFLFPIIMEYLGLQKEELLFQELCPEARMHKTKEIEEKYILLLKSVLLEKKEIEEMNTAVERVCKIIENFLINHLISREEKIYLYNQKKDIKEKIYETEKIEYIVLYISIASISKIEILRKEHEVLQHVEKKPSQKEEKKKSPPMFVQKLNDLSHPIRLTGRVTQEEIRNMLTQKNGPEMSVEEYGERVLQEMKAQGISIPDPTKSSSTPHPEEESQDDLEEGTSSEDNIYDSNADEKRKMKEKKEEVFRGEGNRLGRK
ncbi:hypothetical protein NEFER03_1284 [Nematocida sp. LUAm3]|nr:hypothetical protein NEFER03_1284 [Nematocida sp. LUAm3]KAI5174094.1 hypothetical protein NEFER02_0561 [Nematocida sp. LUAm2]KAI5177163.1 hypothetical protein NEFER01_0438 [Nematocida sp. LUAm1]